MSATSVPRKGPARPVCRGAGKGDAALPPLLRVPSGQGVVLLIALLLGAGLAWRFSAELADRGLALDFGFLGRTAGVTLAETVIPFSPRDSIGWMILAGFANTVRLALIACVAATVIGVAVGIMRLSVNPLLRGIAGGFIGLIRNTPLLLQIFLWYALVLRLPPVSKAISLDGLAFLSLRGLQVPALLWNGDPAGLAWPAMALAAGAAAGAGLRSRPGWPRSPWLPAGIGLLAACIALVLSGTVGLEFPERRGLGYNGGLTLSPEFVAVAVAQSLYAAAFIAELVRGGIVGVPAGQEEAAYSLGLGRWHRLRHVVLPQAMIVIVPSVTTQYVSIIKNSSLAAAIGYPELFWSIVSTINITGRTIEAVFVMLAVYLVPTLVATALIERFNRRIAARSAR